MRLELRLVVVAALLLPFASVFASTVETLALGLLRQNRDPERMELAAFVVREPDGLLRLLPWPAPEPGVARRVTWAGALPGNLVGVIHTHPRDVPRPSTQDRAEARRLRLPFYVVSLTAFCVADEKGSVACRSGSS